MREHERVPASFFRERYASRELTDEAEIKLARQLATMSFVNLGKISPDEVDDEGLLKHDAILPLSTFFGAFDIKTDNQIQAAARLLWKPDVTVDDLRLPIDRIDDNHAAYLLNHHPGTIAEIGSLAKRKFGEKKYAPTVTTLKLLRSMWTFADEHEVQTFVCGLEPKVYPRYQSMFGEALTPLSDDTIEFPGIHGPQRPLMIDVHHAVVDQQSTVHRSAAQKLERFVVGRFITKDADGVLWKE